MKDSNKSKLILIALAFGISVIIFAAYRILFMAGVSEYSKEFISGCIGAVITIFATWALLQYQTNNEITKDQLAGMFKEKLTIYVSFISFLNDIHNDDVLNSEEVKKLIEWATKLSLICRPDVVSAIYEYIFQKIAFDESNYSDLSKTQKQQWKKWMQTNYENMASELNDEEYCIDAYSSIPKIITYLREDIAHKQMSDFEENLDMEATLEKLLGLHCASEIEIKNDGSYIVIPFDATPKKTRKPKVAPHKDIES